MGRQRIDNPALFICDIQDKFRSAIHGFPQVVTTTQKLVKAAKILDIPVFVTTQNAARLGQTVPEISSLLDMTVTREVDKTAFSMMVPELTSEMIKLSQREGKAAGPVTVLLVGIETHICVSQTALDLVGMGHHVYVIADGVSSCNAGERGIALARLARAGCTVTTSEGVLFELVGDAGSRDFKAIAGLVKEFKDGTKEAVDIFCGSAGGGEASGFKL